MKNNLFRHFKIPWLLLGGLLMVVGGSVVWSSRGPQQVAVQQYADHQKVLLRVGETQLQVEIVNSRESIAQGLSGRKEIGSDGMLFLFPEVDEQRFWMKEMEFDLDLIWIAHQTVVDITPNVPKPPASLKKENTHLLPTYSPNQPVDWVLEVPAGAAEKYHIQVGQKVTLSL